MIVHPEKVSSINQADARIESVSDQRFDAGVDN
jgi:hypothetical protein